jgi:hypothetical protein
MVSVITTCAVLMSLFLCEVAMPVPRCNVRVPFACCAVPPSSAAELFVSLAHSKAVDHAERALASGKGAHQAETIFTSLAVVLCFGDPSTLIQLVLA